MRSVLVTGGTGVLGRQVVARLADAGTDVRVLSRRPGGRVPAGAEGVSGDLLSGAGLGEALAGADAVVHCATAASVHSRNDLEATRRLLAAAREAGRPHIVDVSIVGVDRVLLSYYHAKLACETFVLDSGLPCTVLRATQFHDLVLMLLGLLARGPVAAVPKGFHVQPVDTGAVADELATLALGEPAGRASDLAGPRVEAVEDLMRAYLAATGRERRTVSLPLAGKVAADFRAGGHLLGKGRTAGGTFTDFLASRTRPDGTVEQSYALENYVRP